MGKWISVPLSDVLDYREGPGILACDFESDGVPLVRLAGLKRGADILEGCNFLNPDLVAAKWSHFQLHEGDVLLSTSASLGEVAVVGEEGVGAVPYTGIIRFRPLDGRVVPQLIRHLLEAPTFREQIEQMGVGSVMKHFGPTHLRSMTVSFPIESGEQRAIAEVLGALDDKIAANGRLLQLEMDFADSQFARARRSADLTEAAYGVVAEVGGGGTPRTAVEEYWNGDIPWATPTDVTSLVAPCLWSTKRSITEAGLGACASLIYPAGSILMTSRATIGAFAIADIPMAVNQGFIVVNAKDSAFQWWLFHDMRARVQEFLTHANGATFLELSRGRFGNLPVGLPDRVVAQGFADSANMIHQLAALTSRESATLASTRDELLPLLMSGKITIRDAERTVSDLT